MTSKARQLGWWRRAPGPRSGWPGSWPHPLGPPIPAVVVFYQRQILRPFLKSAYVMSGGEGLLWPLGESPPRDPGPSLPLPQTAQTGCSRPDHSPQLLPHPQPCPTGPRWDLGPPPPPLLPAARRAPCQLIRNQAEGGRATLLPPLMWGQKLPQPGTLPCSAPPPGWGGHHFCTPCRCPLWPREQPAGA